MTSVDAHDSNINLNLERGVVMVFKILHSLV